MDAYKHRYRGYLIEISWFASTGRKRQYPMMTIYKTIRGEVTSILRSSLEIRGEETPLYFSQRFFDLNKDMLDGIVARHILNQIV